MIKVRKKPNLSLIPPRTRGTWIPNATRTNLETISWNVEDTSMRSAIGSQNSRNQGWKDDPRRNLSRGVIDDSTHSWRCFPMTLPNIDSASSFGKPGRGINPGPSGSGLLGQLRGGLHISLWTHHEHTRCTMQPTYVDRVSLDAMDIESTGHERPRIRTLLHSNSSEISCGSCVHIKEEIGNGKRWESYVTRRERFCYICPWVMTLFWQTNNLLPNEPTR